MQVQTEHRPEPAENAGATDTPRIYVACLAAYNAGHLHGCWIDAIQDAEDIQDDINAMLK
ncbi:MAG: antirestriction protein ArdA, partial [Kiloniellales bacterium]|nr:antirestriction protein ArdA [Kiloniellales bacterium]